jgi:hypothetical protein
MYVWLDDSKFEHPKIEKTPRCDFEELAGMCEKEWRTNVITVIIPTSGKDIFSNFLYKDSKIIYAVVFNSKRIITFSKLSSLND